MPLAPALLFPKCVTPSLTAFSCRSVSLPVPTIPGKWSRAVALHFLCDSVLPWSIPFRRNRFGKGITHRSRSFRTSSAELLPARFSLFLPRKGLKGTLYGFALAATFNGSSWNFPYEISFALLQLRHRILFVLSLLCFYAPSLSASLLPGYP